MHKVGSLTWRILFSLTLMSNLYKELSCVSIVRKFGNGLEKLLNEKQLPDMTTEDSEQERLIHLGLSQRPFSKVFTPDESTFPGKSEHVGDDGPARKQQSIMSALFQMSKEELLMDAPLERKRRHSAGQQPAGSDCQRHHMYVNFTTLGWNTWIVAPPGYNAYYCAGACSLLQTMLTSTKHGYIQGIMSGYHSQIPKPCCVPTKLSSLQLVYTVNSSILVEQWNEMKVEACGCL